jgi:hypothetical protein
MTKPKLELTREQGWGWNEIVVISAFRYIVGRQTYVVQAFADWLISIWPMLGENTRSVIQRDLEQEFASDDNARQREANYKPLGHDCDRKDWARVRALWKGEMK